MQKSHSPSDSSTNSLQNDLFFPSLEDTLHLTNSIDNILRNFKETLVEDETLIFEEPTNSSEPSFIDACRELGSLLAHETFEGVAQLSSFIPEMADDIQKLTKPFYDGYPELNTTQPQKSPSEDFSSLVNNGHEAIDELFSTTQAIRYTPEAKNNDPLNHFEIGILPPPGALGFRTTALNAERIAITQANKIRGWSIGKPLNNLTAAGDIPQWGTVKSRYWKSKAYYYGKDDIIEILIRVPVITSITSSIFVFFHNHSRTKMSIIDNFMS